MGSKRQSMNIRTPEEMFEVQVESPKDIIVGLAGNPNTGKSTVFNSLTGLRQHTGNWPGKTVSNAQGRYSYGDKDYVLVDLPGTYSLLSDTAEEEIARDFICFGNPHVIVVVADATCLQRNLNLALQVMEMTENIVVCINLIDEAERKKIKIDKKKLESLLGVPVVATSARNGYGLQELKSTIEKVAKGQYVYETKKVKYHKSIEKAIDIIRPSLNKVGISEPRDRWMSLRFLEEDTKLANNIMESLEKFWGIKAEERGELEEAIRRAKLALDEEYRITDMRGDIVSSIVRAAEEIGEGTTYFGDKAYNRFDNKVDKVLTSRTWGIPIMIALLGIVFWITIEGANYPSELLAKGLFTLEEKLTLLFVKWGSPEWLHGILVLGIYKTLAWVISVMLPPMAIFFPLFTLLEDLGYLPRIAFNLDTFFKRACAHGKQALTMCMGFGCNAAGIISCRIIDSPRERLIAILTNNFVPCNGRFPIMISLATIFIVSRWRGLNYIIPTLSVLGAVILGVIVTLIISKILSKTILKGLPSSFILELPPYRKPQVGQILLRSLRDRTLAVLGRAIMVAAPAGLVLWLMTNLSVGNISLLDYVAGILNPFGQILGMDGYIILAFILGFPANEIVMPIIIMSYMSAGSMLELNSVTALGELLINNGWTWLTALSTMLFAVFHFPCGTTFLTIRKETQSLKWAFISFAIPTITGIIICFIVAQGIRLLGLI